uniref:urotensin-2 receptor n=1 Tax=Myxine glutinosa TaxID=7769 RepID=UPI00358EB5BC
MLGILLSIMCIVGVTGNMYTLVVMCQWMRTAGSMYVYIINLALADLVYLSTIPSIVCTYFAKQWYFGDVGCRLILTLDLLTMHASIFILTVMSTERYLAVVKPLDTVKRSRSYHKALTGAVWVLSVFLTLPMMLAMELQKVDNQDKWICQWTWSGETYCIYITVLFATSIVAPGFIIGYLYIRLARTYWISQTSTVVSKEVRRTPNQKVLYMIFSIVLTYWACFLPFWVWQLVRIYWTGALQLSDSTHTYINFVVTLLTYSNSCINPFLYTLLSKNYQEYLKNRQRSAGLMSGRNGSVRHRMSRLRNMSQRSVSSFSQPYTESIVVATLPREINAN